MPASSRLILSLVAAVNFLVAIVAAVELWSFHHTLDRPPILETTRSEDKSAMLRTIHYWGIPPVMLLTATSGILFWKLRGKIDNR